MSCVARGLKEQRGGGEKEKEQKQKKANTSTHETVRVALEPQPQNQCDAVLEAGRARTSEAHLLGDELSKTMPHFFVDRVVHREPSTRHQHSSTTLTTGPRMKQTRPQQKKRIKSSLSVQRKLASKRESERNITAKGSVCKNKNTRHQKLV